MWVKNPIWLDLFRSGNVGDYSKWFIAKSIKCRVPLSEPLSLLFAWCNYVKDDDEEKDFYQHDQKKVMNELQKRS